NIRMTLKKSLEQSDYNVETAINGEDGLQKLKENEFPVILLDMKLPGINGLEVLKRINDLDYTNKVIMITGYGNVETAVETMKLGAVDYLRKPFKPEEIQELVDEVFERFSLEKQQKEAEGFEEYLSLAKAEINKRNFERAVELLKNATSLDNKKPEPFNLLGVIYEMKNNQPEAMKMYRAALALDPTYKPADDNLQRASEASTGEKNSDKYNLGDVDR
ncbi:MAG: response regulator, partial [Halanaerobiales bacterium]